MLTGVSTSAGGVIGMVVTTPRSFFRSGSHGMYVQGFPFVVDQAGAGVATGAG